jgi:hypothetical protein
VIAEITFPRAVAPAPVQPSASLRPEPKNSKAAVVRGWIREAKIAGRSPEWVAAMAITQLGMTQQLAKVYVQGNWDKA